MSVTNHRRPENVRTTGQDNDTFGDVMALIFALLMFFAAGA